jgi:hypothetical protein
MNLNDHYIAAVESWQKANRNLWYTYIVTVIRKGVLFS